MTKARVNRRNRVVDLKQFNKRITSWTDFNSLNSLTENFIENGEDNYGVKFIIKRNNVSKKFAIFVDEKNRMERKEDKMFSHNIGDLLLSKMRYKQQGVSLFKTFGMYK